MPVLVGVLGVAHIEHLQAGDVLQRGGERARACSADAVIAHNKSFQIGHVLQRGGERARAIIPELPQ